MPKQTTDVNRPIDITPTVISTNKAQEIELPAITHLYKTKKGGREWYSSWANSEYRSLKSGLRDPYDEEFIARGNGSVSIDGMGIASLSGDSPRMYVYDSQKEKKWGNVEITVYAKRIAESGKTSSQGIVIGARSEHQDVTQDNPCRALTYYGRILYDSRAVFQKELVHHDTYSSNKPSEKNILMWNTVDGTLPLHRWIGVKFIVRNINKNAVKLELYLDMQEGKNGGDWKKVAEYTDQGSWSQTDSGNDTLSQCGYAPNKVISDPGTSVFIRNDLIERMDYKDFNIREIE